MPTELHKEVRTSWDNTNAASRPPLSKNCHGHYWFTTPHSLYLDNLRLYATRYPEAIALSSTEATRIATELISVFSRMGIPDEILTDQGHVNTT